MFLCSWNHTLFLKLRLHPRKLSTPETTAFPQDDCWRKLSLYTNNFPTKSPRVQKHALLKLRPQTSQRNYITQENGPSRLNLNLSNFYVTINLIVRREKMYCKLDCEPPERRFVDTVCFKICNPFERKVSLTSVKDRGRQRDDVMSRIPAADPWIREIWEG